MEKGTALALLFLTIVAYYGVRLALTDCDLTVGSASAEAVKRKFKNKRVWITGGSSGIGKTLAIRIAKIEGTVVLISARSESGLREVQKAITDAGGRCEILVVDLADLDSLQGKVQEARKILGGDVDILVNNGGISQRSMASDTAFTTDMQIMKVDFLSASILTKAMLDVWMNRPDKSESKGVISIASLAGKMGVPLRTFYCAAKFALVGFMDSLRSEVSADGNIVITNICPGSVCTSIAKNALMGNGEKFGVTDKHIAEGMDAERCVELILTGHANDIPEVWMFGNLKEKAGAYLSQYMPAIFQLVVIRSNGLMKRNYTEMILAAREKEKH